MSGDKKIKLIIFDLDGTLVDAFSAVTKSLNHMFRAIDYPRVDRDTVKRKVGWGETSLIRSFVDEKDLPKAVRIYRKHHREALKHGVKFLPGTRRLLKSLTRQGYTLAIASNRPSRFTHIILRVLEVKPFFSKVICADQAGEKKPHPAMLKEILLELDFRPSESVYIGDMTIDVQAGRRARMKTIAVMTGSSTREEVEKHKPHKIIEKISDVPAVLAEF